MTNVINMHEEFIWSMDHMYTSEDGFDFDLGVEFVHVPATDVVQWKRLGQQLLSLTVKRPAYLRLIARRIHDPAQIP